MSLLALHRTHKGTTHEDDTLNRELLELLPGERLFPNYQVLDAHYLASDGRGREEVIVTLTNYRLFIKSLVHAHTMWLPYGVMDTLVRDDRTLTVVTHDARQLRIAFASDAQRGDVCAIMASVIRTNAEALFAGDDSFARQHALHADAPAVDGWGVFDMDAYLHRLVEHDAAWKLTTVNATYTLCGTYPQCLAVPAAFPIDALTHVAAFRSRGRIPALTWKHPSRPVNITRSSQPSVGLALSISKEDKALVDAIRLTNTLNPVLNIVDARPRLNALGNVVGPAQGGFEINYAHCRVHFFNIENIHAMLCEVIVRSMRDDYDDTRWLVHLTDTLWLRHVRSVLVGAVKIAHMVDVDASSVIIHCSDGWDRTSQLSALTQLLLDEQFRTVRGFACLIEKDWCAFGHRFQDRCATKIHKRGDGDDQAPIFLQFLDAVWQIQRQFPNAFEFTEALLIRLADTACDARYGTFLTNSEQERLPLRLCTLSVWSELLDPVYRERYVSLTYRPTQRVLVPSTSMKSVRLWDGYWLRWDPTC